jgi:hypothetical protein
LHKRWGFFGTLRIKHFSGFGFFLPVERISVPPQRHSPQGWSANASGQALMLVSQLSIVAIFVVSPLGCREQEQPQEDLKENPATHGKAPVIYLNWRFEMPRNIYVVLFALIMIAVVVSVDLLFFKNRFWERLIVNIGIVLVFVAFYLRFLKNP